MTLFPFCFVPSRTNVSKWNTMGTVFLAIVQRDVSYKLLRTNATELSYEVNDQEFCSPSPLLFSLSIHLPVDPPIVLPTTSTI